MMNMQTMNMTRRMSPMKARWSVSLAAAALLALPVAAFAQSPRPAPTRPAATQQPPAQQPPAQQPPMQQPPPTQPPAAQPPAGGVDPAAAKAHLSEARETLSALTAMPEASKLQGEARTAVSQLISNFNELITTQSEWHAAYAKVDANLTSLLGPEAGDQPVGTSGKATLDPAIRAKLVEFRTHLKAFEASAGGGSTPSPTPAAAAPASETAPPPPAAADTNPAANSEAQKELEAISAILGQSPTGTLTKVQTAEVKKHVETLRQLLKSGRSP
jgi:hypothetical protein